MNSQIKQRKILIYILSAIILLAVTSCSLLIDSDQKDSGGFFNKNVVETKVYFTKSNGPEEIFIVAVPRKISKEDSIVDGSLKELFLGPTKREEVKGIMTEIPVGTRIIKVEESNDEVLIDVSSRFLTGGGSAAMQLRYLQIYKTLKRLAPDKKIYLQIDGKNIRAIGGEGLEITQPLSKINDYTKKYDKVDGVQP